MLLSSKQRILQLTKGPAFLEGVLHVVEAAVAGVVGDDVDVDEMSWFCHCFYALFCSVTALACSDCAGWVWGLD